MANTQTTVPTFVDGQVLGGERLNQSAGTGVPVFATTVTRDAGFGGSGEKTLAEGQLCYLESTNVVQYYDGAAWATLAPAPAASSGLVCIQAETAFNAVSSVTVDSIFTSTYTNYKIMMEYQTSTTNDVVLQLRASGTASTTGYNAQRLISQGSATYPTSENATSSFSILNNTSGAFVGFGDINLWSPQLAQITSLESLMNQPNGAYSTLYAGYRFGVHNVATAYDGFIFSTATGTFTGKYTVYGFAKAV